MKHVKVWIFLFITSLLLTSVLGCNSARYADNVSVETIDTSIKEALALDGGYYNADSDFMVFKFNDPDYVDEYAITFAQTSTDISEYGIFHVNDPSKVADMADLAKSYLESYKSNWMSNYLAEEYPKIENAEVKTFGNYVVYSILDENATKSLHGVIEQLLAQ